MNATTAMKVDPLSYEDRARETTGERLVRIETILTHLGVMLEQHIREEEKEFVEMREDFKLHLQNTGTVGEDVRALSREIKLMQDRMVSLETQVTLLSKTKLQIVAWAGGVSATMSALWIVAGERISRLFG